MSLPDTHTHKIHYSSGDEMKLFSIHASGINLNFITNFVYFSAKIYSSILQNEYDVTRTFFPQITAMIISV